MSEGKNGLYQPKQFHREYRFFSAALAVIAIYALCLDSPLGIWRGLMDIMTSRSLLVTDYMAVGGPGAMLMNGALAGLFGLALMYLSGVRPSGAIIMALWMTVGFGFFGKNIFNMLPLVLGVWLYARAQKKPFTEYSLASLLVATLCPVVSEVAFGDVIINHGPVPDIILSVIIGVISGFLFPIVSSFTVRVHDGYNLYNMGFSGGLIAMFLIAGFKAGGLEIHTAQFWAGDMNVQMAALLYILCVMLIAGGFVLGRGKDHAAAMKRIVRSSGRLVSDYYSLYGETAYINMGLLGIFATTVVLAIGGDINGPTMGGVLTIMAFGCFGKHLRNIVPVMAGALAAIFANVTDTRAPVNLLALLFSTGLAPIAGQYGIIWGMVAGFIHVNIVIHAGYMTNGLNLYNNGFAAGFVAMLLVPVINALSKPRD